VSVLDLTEPPVGASGPGWAEDLNANFTLIRSQAVARVNPGPDPAAAVQAAIDDLVTGFGGGKVMLPFDVLDWTSIPQLPPNLARPLEIVGDGTEIRLSNAGPCAFGLGKLADFDTFRRLRLRGFKVDANNVGGASDAVILGTVKRGVGTLGLVNIDDLELEDIETVNVPIDTNTVGQVNNRANVVLVVYRPNAGTTDGAPNTITGIRCKGVRMKGGNEGIIIAGTASFGDGLEVYVDDVLLEDCHHHTGIIPTTFFPCNNFQIGSWGYGGKATIKGCTGKGSGDDGVETNGLDTILVEDTEIEDSWTAFFHDNFHTPDAGYAGQRISYRNCKAKFKHATGHAPQGWGFSGGATPPGHMLLEGCSYYRKSPELYTTEAKHGEAFGSSSGLGGVMRSLTVRDFSALVEGVNQAPALPNYYSLFSCDVASPQVELTNLRLALAANLTGWGVVPFRFVSLFLSNNAGNPGNRFRVRDVVSDIALTGDPGTPQLSAAVQVNHETTAVSGKIEGVRVASGCASNPIGVGLNIGAASSTPDQRVEIGDVEWAGLASAIPVTMFGNAISNMKVRQRPGRYGLTYGATVQVPFMEGDVLAVGVTNGSAFTIADPVQTAALNGGPLTNSEFDLEITNSSGGVLGAITWGAGYTFPVAFVAPPAGKTYVYKFRYTGATWLNVSRMAA
jgi:hypothetical protein